jgi:hypothetical protein
MSKKPMGSNKVSFSGPKVQSSGVQRFLAATKGFLFIRFIGLIGLICSIGSVYTNQFNQ